MVGVPLEQVKQKSTSSDTIMPSFLTLQFDQQPLLRRLALRMQRPTVVAEVGFILAVAKFALPDFALSGGVHAPLPPVQQNGLSVVSSATLPGTPTMSFAAHAYLLLRSDTGAVQLKGHLPRG